MNSEKISRDIWNKTLEAGSWIDMTPIKLLGILHEEWFQAYQKLENDIADFRAVRDGK